MDVAQALHSQQPQPPPELSSPSTPPPELEVSPAISLKPSHLRSQPVNSTDRRKSSYEKYSAIALPPLKEEATPISSPAGTLSRSADLSLNQYPSLQIQPERPIDIHLRVSHNYISVSLLTEYSPC